MKKKKLEELYAEMCVAEDLKKAGEISAIILPQMTTGEMRRELDKVTDAWSENRNIYIQPSEKCMVIVTTRQEVTTLENHKKTWLSEASVIQEAWGNFDFIKKLLRGGRK